MVLCVRGKQAHCVWVIVSVWPRRRTTVFGKEKITEISFLPFSLHNLQENYLMSNHLLYRTVIFAEYYLINGWNRIWKQIAFYESFFSGTNGAILDTKPWENRKREPASSPCSQRLDELALCAEPGFTTSLTAHFQSLIQLSLITDRLHQTYKLTGNLSDYKEHTVFLHTILCM